MTARERLAALAEGTPVATLVMRDDLKTVLADLEAAERERDEAQVALIDAVLAASGHPVALEAAEQRAETLAKALDDVRRELTGWTWANANIHSAIEAALADRTERTHPTNKGKGQANG